MRIAECLTAAGLLALSVWFMVLAQQLPIGWVPDAGPGGGAFPFWLSLIMGLCAAAILVRELRRWLTDGDGGAFFAVHARARLAVVGVGLVLTVAAIPIVGTYVAIAVFMFVFLRGFGRHRWRTTAAITVATPVILFFFFEATLKILLPKGYTEPLFFPLYVMFL